MAVGTQAAAEAPAATAATETARRATVPIDRRLLVKVLVAAEFHKALEKYIAVPTKVGGTRTRRGVTSKQDLVAIGEWGKANGFKVSDRGRVSAELKDAYTKAH